MIQEVLNRIVKMPSAAIIAPAGHGKTEMIADIVKESTGRQLLLTHTNAGVDVLEKRMKKRGISKSRYTIYTIAAFCLRWCTSYCCTAPFDKDLTPFNTEKQNLYYDQLYSGAASIFTCQWAGDVLTSTYCGVIVDEYQDCTQEQHRVVLALNKFIPVRILGDPLQGIFYWAGTLVDWNTLEFPVVDVETKPWRWLESNPVLGAYLADIRTILLPTLKGIPVQLVIPSCEKCFEIINPDTFNPYDLLPKLSQYATVLYIAKLEYQQLSFSNRMAGIFQNDEAQDNQVLFDTALSFDDNDKTKVALNVLDFAKSCSTKIANETKSYRNNLLKNSWDFHRIKKHPELKVLLQAIREQKSLVAILDILDWILKQSSFKVYRRELFSEMQRGIKYAIDNHTSVLEAVYRIRRDVNLQKRYSQFKFLSSRTVLIKGLEFDCVIIDMRDQLQSKDFYVALTRATKKVYIISATNTFRMQP